jgi:hypothetical protein
MKAEQADELAANPSERIVTDLASRFRRQAPEDRPHGLEGTMPFDEHLAPLGRDRGI